MKIVCVFKTHFDIGFTELSSKVVEKYGTSMIEDVLNACEQTESRPVGKRFVWTMATWPLIQTLKTCSQTNYDRAIKYLKNGQLVFHALPFTLHTETLSITDMPHLYDYAHELCDTYGLKMPISAKMTDVPGHTLALIDSLCENGVKFLHLGCNPASTHPDVPTLFWWESKKGNRILTFYNGTYGSNILPPRGWKYPVWLAMQQTNDNVGPQEATILDTIQSEVEKNNKNAEIIFGSMDDFYSEIVKCDLSDLPVVREDLGDTWIHGVGTYPKEVGLLRRARNVVSNVQMTKEDEINFFENSLLFSEHTWGMDVKTFLTWQRSYEKNKFLEERKLPRYELIEKSWDEQRNRANVCVEIAKKYGTLFEQFPPSTTENDTYKLTVSDGKPTIINKNTGRRITLEYIYNIIGTDDMTKFLRKYLTRFYAWSITDFGRDSYGETPSRTFKSLFKTSREEDGVLVVTYATPTLSKVKYGNTEDIIYELRIIDDKIVVRVKLNNKVATPYLEAGNLYIRTNCEGKAYYVKKIDSKLNVAKDIRKDANNILYCVSDLAQIDDVEINPIDAPLVSFGSNAIFKFNGGTFKKPKHPDFVFNLFNNQWGTNFPQWIEGDLIYDFIIKL